MFSYKILFKRGFVLLGAVLFSGFLSIDLAFARAGGGGSGSGGGGGGGGSGGGSGVGGYFSLILITFFIVVISIVTAVERKRLMKKTARQMKVASGLDPTWEGTEIRQRVTDVFFKFQKAWSDLDASSFQEFLVDDYYKRMVIELNVLKNEKRRNSVENPVINAIYFVQIIDATDNGNDSFTAEIHARTHDVLIDTASNQILFVDDSSFTEYWHFVRVGTVWKLESISQATEEAASIDPDVHDFARLNNFYYDADFGWLMMPNKGVLFSKSNFAVSDINNHVIGYYRRKIVEFYTYTPRPGSNFGDTYLVAQAVLPVAYENIVVWRKNKFFNFAPKGLRRIELESADFNKKFCLYASPRDQVNLLELLTPNFMEKIYAMPFEVSIEIVGNFLYLSAKNYNSSHFPEMLEALSWAFDEMKM